MTTKLTLYRHKRSFTQTPEPAGEPLPAGRKQAITPLHYVVQEHHASRLHYDFRLELDGTLKSWAVPKGPSFDPAVKRLAVHVEDHPLAYASFEGEIPAGQYGAGSVIVWDAGVWIPEGGVAQARMGYQAGKLIFRLEGEKLHGGWALVRSHSQNTRQEQWLLIKQRDDEARSAEEFDVIAERPGRMLRTHTKATKATKAVKNTNQNISKEISSALSKHNNQRRNSRQDTGQSLTALTSIKRGVLPSRLAPQLATLVDAPPMQGDWRYEMKFDGYRILTRIVGAKTRRRVTMMTRQGHDWTAKFGALPAALAALEVQNAWLDGEAVALNHEGIPDFQALQNALSANHSVPITLFLFDILYLNGRDLREMPLANRRSLLAPLLTASDPALLRYSPDLSGDVSELLASACAMGLEGLIGKRAAAPYSAGRSLAWIKLKCRRRQEFVIGGYTEPSGSRIGFGALLLGVYDCETETRSLSAARKHARLRYVGRVGTGFNRQTLDRLAKLLQKQECAASPFAVPPHERNRTRVHWIKPTLLVECEFAEWTSDGLVRQASFVALRHDKPAAQVCREDALASIAAESPSRRQQEDKAMITERSHRTVSASDNHSKPPRTQLQDKLFNQDTTKIERNDTTVGRVQITHPDRLLDPVSGTRKIDLVHYWQQVAPWLLPDLKGRPVAIVRAPHTIDDTLFFQKHAEALEIPFVTQHAGLDPGHGPLLTIDTTDALIGAAQMGAIELHTWNAHASHITRPDRIVFDLDPDPVLAWGRMIEAAQLMHALLDELGLLSFCKTSGGKGLHIVVPITRHASWDDMKDFSKMVAQHLATTLPDRFTAKMGPRNRQNKIFIDYLRNNRGASTIAAYSTRARPGIGVSVPVSWDEVTETTGGAQWTIDTLAARLGPHAVDPWDGYHDVRQRVTARMRAQLMPLR